MPLPDYLPRTQHFLDQPGASEREHQIAVGQRAAILSRGVELHIEREIAVLIDPDNPANRIAPDVRVAGPNIKHHHPWLAPR